MEYSHLVCYPNENKVVHFFQHGFTKIIFSALLLLIRVGSLTDFAVFDTRVYFVRFVRMRKSKASK